MKSWSVRVIQKLAMAVKKLARTVLVKGWSAAAPVTNKVKMIVCPVHLMAM